MKTFLYKIATVLLFCTTLYACEDVVEVEINPEDLDLISVEAYLTSRSTDNVWVKIQKSLPIDETENNPPLSNAIVEVSDDANTPNTVILEETSDKGIYKVPDNTYYHTEPGRTYSLKITTPDGVVISGQEYLQKVEPLDSVKVNLSPRGEYEYLAIFISSKETEGPGHFYKWDIYVNRRLLYKSDMLAFANDELVEGNYIYDMELFTDWYEEGDEDSRTLNIGDTINVVQASISRDVYSFYLGMQNQAFSGSPFSVPPANIPSNLVSSNGKKVLGLFTARDVSLGNTVVIDSTNFTPLVPFIEN